jgi:SOS-response transcriptional repressor LexA
MAAIVGSSMTDPLDPFGPHSLHEGMVAWVDSNLTELVDGEVMLIQTDKAETVKQLVKLGEEWWCMSYDRANHPSFKLEEEFKVLGTVYRTQSASQPFKPRR